MATQQKPDESTNGGTSVATTKPALPANIQANIDERRARNQMVAAIRGTQWGAGATPELARSIAEYCRQNNLDPVRHVEVLGGRIYLTASLYDEKGAHLIRSGEIIPDEPDYINADSRFEEIEKSGTEGAKAWAREEAERRLQARITYNVPEKAAAAVVQRFHIPSSGAVITGVNWCGGGSRKSDPVGDSEPAKTAQTRARRRAWLQIADIIPGYADVIRPLEATAKVANEALPVSVVEAPPTLDEPRKFAALQEQSERRNAIDRNDVYHDDNTPGLWAPESGDGKPRLGDHQARSVVAESTPTVPPASGTFESPYDEA